MVGNTDGVDLLALVLVDRDAVGYQSLAVDLPASRRNGHPAGVLYALLRGQLGADLDEELRLQLVEPGDPTAHSPAGVVLGEPVSRHDVRIPRVLGLVVG